MGTEIQKTHREGNFNLEMKFKKLKPVECTRYEFELVKGIIKGCSCLDSAVSLVRTELVVGSLKWECETNNITTMQAQDMAYNIVQAVLNNYTYLMIVD